MREHLDTTPPVSLVRYEQTIMDLLFRKDPEPHILVLGGRSDRWRVYRRMARHRLSDVLANSFRRLSGLLGDSFPSVVERFFDEAPPRSPYIRDVPGELAAWLETAFPTLEAAAALPPWTVELARHEWALLDVSYIAEEQGALRADVGELRMDRPAVLAPAHRLLRARWSVHRFGTDLDRSVVVEGPFALCLYRDPITHEVRALELSPVAADLLEGVDSDGGALVDVVRRAAEKNGSTIDEPFVASLSDLIADLVERGLWLGSLADPPSAES